METFFIIQRAWTGLSDTFPYKRFDNVPNEHLQSKLDELAGEWLQSHGVALTEDEQAEVDHYLTIGQRKWCPTLHADESRIEYKMERPRSLFTIVLPKTEWFIGQRATEVNGPFFLAKTDSKERASLVCDSIYDQFSIYTYRIKQDDNHVWTLRFGCSASRDYPPVKMFRIEDELHYWASNNDGKFLQKIFSELARNNLNLAAELFDGSNPGANAKQGLPRQARGETASQQMNQEVPGVKAVESKPPKVPAVSESKADVHQPKVDGNRRENDGTHKSPELPSELTPPAPELEKVRRTLSDRLAEDSKVERCLLVLRKLQHVPGEYVPRSELRSVGITATSVDQDFNSYGKGRSKLQGRNRMFLKSYLEEYVLRRWDPR